MRSGNLGCLPRNLAEVYHLYSSRAFPTADSFSGMSQVLAICLAAAQPLLLTDIVSIVLQQGGHFGGAGTGNGAAIALRVAEDLQKLGHMVRLREERLEFCHCSVRNWFQDPGHR